MRSICGSKCLSSAAAAIIAVATSFLNMAVAEEYPSRPIKVVSPFAPGGVNDWLARQAAKAIADALHASVYVENRPGGGTIPATDYVAKSAPDGYTLLLSSNTAFAIAPSLYKKLPFNPRADLAFIAAVGNGPYLLVVRDSLPVRTLADLVSYARSNPGKLSFGSTGNGTPAHLGGELLKSMVGIDMVHIPYKGSAPALTDLAGGQIDLAFDPVGSSNAMIRTGKIRPIAVTSAARTPLLPDVPAASETVAGFDVNVLYCIVAPAGTSQEIISKLRSAIVRQLSSADAIAASRVQGIEYVQYSPSAFATFIASETSKWAKIIQLADIKPD